MHVHVYTRRGKTCGSYVHLCAPLAAIEIMQSGGARERERGERMGSALETGKKKGKRKRKKGGGETVGEMEKELDSELTNLCKKRVAPRGNNPAPEIL